MKMIGNYIEYGNKVINLDNITHIEKVKNEYAKYEYHVYTVSGNYVILTPDECAFLESRLKEIANTYIRY